MPLSPSAISRSARTAWAPTPTPTPVATPETIDPPPVDEFEYVQDGDIDFDGIPDSLDVDLDDWGDTDDDDIARYQSMFNTDIEYSVINLYTEPDDLEISAEVWEQYGEDMVTLVVNNRASRSWR